MKQLFKVASADILQSLMPILTWYAIGLAYGDTDYFNVFTLTYYFQFVYSIMNSILVKGTIKHTKKMQSENIEDIYSSILISSMIFSAMGTLIWLNLDSVMLFMNVDAKYKNMFILGIIYLNLEIIICGICKVEQYYSKEKDAFWISIRYYLFKIISASMLGLLIKDELTAVTLTVAVTTIYVIVLCFRKFGLQRLTLDIFRGVKYEASSLVGNISLFVIYFFGIQQVAGQSALFLASYNICAMCTDTQWDILSSVIDTTTSVEICDGTYEKNKKKIGRNAILWGIILFVSSLLMILVSYLFAAFSLKIAITILLLECVWFPLYSIRYSYEAWIKLEHGGAWLVAIYIVSYVIRTIITFTVKSEYNLSIGVLIIAVFSGVSICSLYFFQRKKYKVLKGDVTNDSIK